MRTGARERPAWRVLAAVFVVAVAVSAMLATVAGDRSDGRSAWGAYAIAAAIIALLLVASAVWALVEIRRNGSPESTRRVDGDGRPHAV